jgi:ATP-dependent phosphofructokinase / diphosphate-dependent phosphofructokinase
MARATNVVVAQSGGPTPVINCSLRGVIEACQAMPDVFGTIYGGFHGIEGVLKEELLNLSAQSPQEIALLSTTPAAGAIGSCRYKLRARQAGDFDRVLEVFRAHDVGYFFYIGGNDSMDTAHKVSELARARGLDRVATGVPKTIDNDMGDPDFKLIGDSWPTAPLIDGRQRFARLEPIFAPQKLVSYTPQALRANKG